MKKILAVLTGFAFILTIPVISFSAPKEKGLERAKEVESEKGLEHSKAGVKKSSKTSSTDKKKGKGKAKGKEKSTKTTDIKTETEKK